MSDLSTRPLSALSIDPDERPKMPAIAGATDEDRRNGRALAHIHAHYLQEMGRVQQVLERIAAGDVPPDELRHIILHSDMRQNLEAAGTICGHQCQVLKMHHDIEAAHMFPGLDAQGDAALSRIVERLREEHKIVHELLIRLEAAARRLSTEKTDASFQEARAIFAALHSVILSHFGYEETELEEAIGVYLGGI